MKLDFVAKTTKPSGITTSVLRGWAADELKKHGLDDNWQLEVVLVDEKEIQKLNKKYRKIDKATDVLSFPIFDKPAHEGNGEMLGTIVLCPQVCVKQAHENGKSEISEVELLVRHSIKHLIGIHHK